MLLPALATLPLAMPALVQAQDAAETMAPARQCRAPGSIPDRGALQRAGDQPMDIRAETMRSPGRNAPISFTGDVELAYGDQRLQTDTLIYDPTTGEVRLPGWLEYTDAVVRMRAASAEYDTRDSSGRFDGVQYYIAGAEGAGNAASVQMLDETTARVVGFDFTTCGLEDPDWQLKAGRVELDFERGVGTARNARFEFKGVPLLYVPWMRFPLDDRRQTGFLYPTLGTSSDNGIDLRTPFYWNIAPNMDATFTPRFIGDRGLMLGSEFRFLTRRQAGTFEFDYLPEDDVDGEERWLGRIRHRARLAPSWTASMNFNRVSDDDYFLDFGNDLESTAIQFLRS
ncbi:MAG: LPS assembly protein LptD, partial [Wenzhouxiangellaceae bacterium]|nr:LPS assembly protein LptD [Wenzhouxiangellaceae bacterium]